MRLAPILLLLSLPETLACRPPGAPAPPVAWPAAGELPAPERDAAVACLLAGTCTPSFDDLGSGEQDELLELVGRTLHAYGSASFASFLALRRRDLSHARQARAGDVEAVLGHARRLGVPVTGDEDWLEALGAFWCAYYPRPPVARWQPECTRVTLGTLAAPDEALLRSWEEAYERRMVTLGLPTVEAALAVPHRREVLECLDATGGLRWIELDLSFESACGEPMRLWMRFVRDAVGEEWFLHRATTFYPQDSQGPCNLLL